MNTIQLDSSTITSILSLIVTVIIVLISVILSYVIIQVQRALNRAKEAEDKFKEAKKEIDALNQKLEDRYERELLRGHLKDLMSADSTTRGEAIKVIEERGTSLCIRPLLNVLKNDQETDENRKLAEEAISAIIDRIEKPIPETILREMEKPRGYIDIVLSNCRRMIEEILTRRQKRRVLKKSRKHKT